MALPNLSIPSISISLADDPPIHLPSPLDSQPPSPPSQEDEYRSSFLSPPPVFSPRLPRQSSPLRPAETSSIGKGLDPARFEALLASTRSASSKKESNLRKELAMKAHKSKQMERRALFLSKVNAPPSPTATALPKTPPESPAILHYTLPSPGLDSPLALFETLQQTDPTEPVKPWVEQVHYRQLNGASVRPPSLEQITAHLSSLGHSVTATTVKDECQRPSIRLPTFLRSPPRMKNAVLQHHVGSGEGTDGEQNPEAEIRPPTQGPGELLIPQPKTRAVPSLSGPALLVTTTTVPGASKSSSSTLTKVNLSALNSRALTRRDMMSKLKRRVSGLPSADGMGGCGVDEDERRARRVSAPAELPKRERDGFAHLVLALPGAF